MATAIERELKKLAKRHDLTVVSLGHTGGTHYKLTLQRSDGDTMFFITALTTSDRRSLQNLESRVKRFSLGQERPNERSTHT